MTSRSAPDGAPRGRALLAAVTAGLPLLAIAPLGVTFALPPLGATAGIAAVAAGGPMMRNRAVVGGYFVAIAVGLVAGVISHSMVAAALASAFAVGLAVAADAFHPPAVAAAYLATRYAGSNALLIRGFAVGVAVLVATGYLARWWANRQTSPSTPPTGPA